MRHAVLLVEDDPLTRARIARAVASDARLELVAEAGSCAEGRECLAGKPPRVLLVDLGLPDGSGVDLIRDVRLRRLPTEVMVITVFGDEKHVVAALEAGAKGYLLKDGTSGYIASSILDLVNGGSPISPAIARHLLRRFHEPTAAATEDGTPVPQLTERETEVLGLLVKGFTFQEIGKLLGISPHTVNSHVKHIYEKLEVRSRSEAVYEALQMGLVRTEV